MSSLQGELYSAMSKVMTEVKHVQKTGNNTHDRYTYTTDADLLRSLQPAMAKHGLALAPTDVQVTRSEHNTKSGASHDRVDVVVTYTLGHSGGGELKVVAPGTGVDRSDKAVYKAMTGAYKYALRQTFAVPTGDNAEEDSGEERAPSHHPSWKADQPGFFAELGRLGVDYEALCTHLKSRPSGWASDDRKRMLRDLGTPGHKLAVAMSSKTGAQQ